MIQCSRTDTIEREDLKLEALALRRAIRDERNIDATRLHDVESDTEFTNIVEKLLSH